MQVSRGSFFRRLVFSIILLLGFYPIAYGLLFLVTPFEKGSQRFEIIEVVRNQTPWELSKLLSKSRLISSPNYFYWTGKLCRTWKSLKTGEYRFSPSMTPYEIFSILSSGVSIPHPVTIREGENFYEIADDLQSKGLTIKERFLSLARDSNFLKTLDLFDSSLPPSLEGYFFPDTYFFNKTLNDQDMIKQMIRHFKKFWRKPQDDRARELGFSRHQIVVLASMIEKETGAPEERSIISSVFHNRLKLHMRLQSDPTTIYGMWERYQGKIHRSDLLEKTAYNTYMMDGLPFGPISNPGAESLNAALFPIESEFLYFVSHNDGTHQFSKTFAEHSAAVKKFQLDPRARAGKSWRDLKKRVQSL